MQAAATPSNFNLTRWFAVTALAAILLLAGAVGVLLNRFIAARMLSQEAALTNEFFASLLVGEPRLVAYLANPDRGPVDAQLREVFDHLTRIPDVHRVNLYDRQSRLIWSSEPKLLGMPLNRNPELERSLAGEVVAEPYNLAEGDHEKSEHEGVPGSQPLLVEIYVPVRAALAGEVLGAIEFYKRPHSLTRAIGALGRYIAWGAVIAGGILFITLYGVVRRAEETIRSQQKLLLEQERMAALGEMSGAVAHGIRNPLGSIRSTAELMLEGPPEAAQAARDIVEQSDRLEWWVRELLAYLQPPEPMTPRPVSLAPVVTHCLEDFHGDFTRRGIVVGSDLPGDLPYVRGDELMLAQVLRTVLTNAIEALGPGGGRVDLRGSCVGQEVVLEVRDNGRGMSPEQLQRVGEPFYTTKSGGLGVGLAMARRAIERAGGRLRMTSAQGQGTLVCLHLARA